MASLSKLGPSTNQLKPGLSLFDSVTLVAGSMIGSGIFIVSADITRQVGTPFALLMVWLVAGVMTIAGALAYGELAAMMPAAGGQYVYLREAYGGMWAFMFGWTLLLVIQTGTIAAVAVAFARFAGVMWPVLGSTLWFGAGGAGLSGERAGAIIVIAVLTAANLRGLNMGKWLQNSFTTAKILSLCLIVAVGCVLMPNPAAIHANFGSSAAFFGSSSTSIGAGVFGAAMVGALFSADAWASVTFAAAEVRNPKRDLPLALAFGTGVVIALYILTNLAYLCELPASGTADAATVVGRGIAHASSDRVAAAAMQVVWGGAGAKITAVLVMISGFGCANGLILTGARVIYAMSQDRVFFAAAGRLNRASVPAVALVMQGIWAALLTLSGTYSELLDYVIFAQLMFYVLTVSAVFVLRRRRPDAPRPYRAWGYPIVPALYVVAASALMIDLLILKPRFTWPGLLIALSGVPIYYWTTRPRSRRG
ncbi:MAG: amino acid permease [Candidatus Binatus sp.]|jgi:APA family basic amino acid/polyamine antiporter|uniref:APC family permease n=1 Tax=Candidatus Binatus sp. TaxID=2811406 RepID=UPI003C72400D